MLEYNEYFSLNKNQYSQSVLLKANIFDNIYGYYVQVTEIVFDL